ncbi:DEAD/DEAH box helicase [Coniochaeta ligniaria NRRL 30616]|uniref:ATP-dependent RNA helicase n=1 Tax=Coniochaeta ligniaria NRRL 30616 TaxID=1408157 RepID=A0A1J7I9T4_9PEZI|nr:DEAD/DEAH box helicase [Coniochaeta ligniaria NRRL 30616]
MDTNQKKRKQGASEVPQKRRKTQQPQQVKSKRPVAVDKLRWKTVDVPEMFDDAEGFYGLEEVEGVEVVRQGDTISFVTAAAAATDDSEAGEAFEGFDDEPETDKSTAEVTKAATTDQAGDVSPTEAVKPKSKAVETKKEKAAQNKKEKKDVEKKEKIEKKDKKEKKDQPKPSKDDAELNVDFTKLEEVADEEEGTDVSAWAPLDLSPDLMAAISRLKFAKPTAIQSRAIPAILEGLDVIGKASTGSGKTLAFGIPIVEQWLSSRDESEKDLEKRDPIALILAPTRELAHQITTHIKSLCSGMPNSPYICSVTGGLSVEKQQRQLKKAEIVIGTPGRFWEVISGSNALLEGFKNIRFLVVDEADRLLSEGHFKEAEEILKALDRNATNEDEDDDDDDDDEEDAKPTRQTLVFSATFNKGLQQKLAGKGKYDLMDEAQSMEYLLKKLNFRTEPKYIDVNPVSQMAQRLREGLVECGAMEKDLYLYALLLLQPTRRALVFTNSISSVRRIVPFLQNLGLPAIALHSEMAQKARLRSLERFTAAANSGAKHAPIMVATDVAARGLDIPGIELVVHYHVPRAADAYVHRSGRTARASSSGLSILLCGPDEVVSTRRLVAKVHAAAQSKARQAGQKSDKDTPGFFVRTIDIDRKLVSRLRERVVLAKKIADAALAKERGNKDENWMKAAAEELGVEYDSEDLDKAGKWGGRGSGRKRKEKEDRDLTKAEVGALKAELRELLSRRVNAGVSEKYITGSGVDIDELLKGVEGQFLGKVDGLDIDF